ncbi:MAG: hypothetical protein ACKO1Z_01680, partial [Actinomycetota bacterium]
MEEEDVPEKKVQQQQKGKRKKTSGTLNVEAGGSVETQLLTDMAANISDNDKRSIRKQCEVLLKKICTNEETVLPMEEVVKIVKQWQPQREILCLYVRIARKLPVNFHLDSISTLLCISKQCGFTPVSFLKKTKTLVINPASSGKFGSTYAFNTISTKGADEETLHRKLVGLSMTLSLLEHSVANSSGVISRNGMRCSTTREPIKKSINLAGDTSSPPKNFSIETMPSHEFHKRASLIHRLWLSINHRWMSFHVVYHLFAATRDDSPLGPIDDNSILVYSFMMHSGFGKSRYDFLDPLVGVCFRFTTRADIQANHSRLKELWLNPSNFVRFGNNCLQRDGFERKVSLLVDTFKELRSLPRTLPYYGRTTDEGRKWLMLRGYIFSYWLKRDSCSHIRSEVEDRMKATLRNPRVQVAPSPTETSKEKNSDYCYAARNKKQRIQISYHDDNPANASTNDNDGRRLWSQHPEGQDNHGNEEDVVQTDHGTETQPPAPAATGNTDLPRVDLGLLVDAALTTDRGGGPVGASTILLDLKDTRTQLLQKEWTSLKLTSQKQLDEVIASYLLIHTDLCGMDILLKLSPLEVYSADRLKDFLHCRLCGRT